MVRAIEPLRQLLATCKLVENINEPKRLFILSKEFLMCEIFQGCAICTHQSSIEWLCSQKSKHAGVATSTDIVDGRFSCEGPGHGESCLIGWLLKSLAVNFGGSPRLFPGNLTSDTVTATICGTDIWRFCIDASCQLALATDQS